VVLAFCLKMVVCETPQFTVNQGQQGVERLFVALLPVMQQLGDLGGMVFGHVVLARAFSVHSIFVQFRLVNCFWSNQPHTQAGYTWYN
jgi:hypothetical protein